MKFLKYNSILLIIGLIAIIYVIVDYKKSDNVRIKYCIKSCNERKALFLKGNVIDKKLIGDNHRGIMTVYISQNEIDTVKYYSSFHQNLNFVEIGDSVIKSIGTFEFEIYRKDKLVYTINDKGVDCDCICTYSYKECIDK